MTGSFEEDVQARLATMREKARHPSLALWNFVAGPDALPDVDEISDEDIPKENEKTLNCAEPH